MASLRPFLPMGRNLHRHLQPSRAAFSTSIPRPAYDSSPGPQSGLGPNPTPVPQARENAPAPASPGTLPGLPPKRTTQAHRTRTTSVVFPTSPQKKLQDAAETVRKHPAIHDIVSDVQADSLSRYRSNNYAGGSAQAAMPKLVIRAVPKTGRTVHLGANNWVQTPERAFEVLHIQLVQNKIPGTAVAQRFYERPGLRKKRVRRSRWRARFKRGFNNTIIRVQELVRQGW